MSILKLHFETFLGGLKIKSVDFICRYIGMARDNDKRAQGVPVKVVSQSRSLILFYDVEMLRNELNHGIIITEYTSK